MSSHSSKRSKVLLKLQEEELERQVDARKAILEAERRVKQFEIDEYKRQQLQKYRDVCQLDGIESNSSESDCMVEETVQTKTSEWSIPWHLVLQLTLGLVVCNLRQIWLKNGFSKRQI